MSLNQKETKVASVTLGLIFLGVADGAPLAIAQSAGTFTTTGNMTTVRAVATATLLPGGKVLIAGGTDWDFTIGSAEVYDPSTGTFTATGSMSVPRADHTATLLPTGKVLIIGGSQTLANGPGNLLSSAEIYDPATETFSPVGNMSVGRQSHTAMLLANGKVLIAGGTSLAWPLELYDPLTGTFSITATTLPLGVTAGDGAAATLLADGTVFFATLPYGSLGGGVVYNPATDSFRYLGGQGSGYFHHAVSPLLDGRVLITGGGDLGPDVGSVLAGAQLYDPSVGGFARTGNMAVCRYFHTSTLLPSGSTLIAGGLTTASDGICASADAAVQLASTELYDPSTAVFITMGDMSTARSSHTATLLNDGSVLIAGGSTSLTADIYHPPVLIAAPALFSLSGDGQGQGAIWHVQTGQLASADTPAVAGEALSMYTTSLADGSVITPQVILGGRLAQVLYYGAAPGYPGYYQVNFVVPAGVPPGPAVSVRLTYIGRSSNAVAIGVR
jgi:hypothetical protein